MASYKLLFKQSVAKDLRVPPKKDVQRIITRIDTLAENPRAVGCKKLSGQEFYRVRQGGYRIVYEIIDDQLVVHIIRVAQRARPYRS